MEAASLLMATELRLGLPGTDDQKTTTVSPPATPRGKKRIIDAFEETTTHDSAADKSDDVEAAPPVAKAQVVGWPPVRSYRKSCFQATKSKAKKAEDASSNNTTPSAAPAATSTNGSGSFVKVSMDGAPYLRKVDMRMYKGYRELREALEAMFVCFSGADASNGANPSEYAITYEDKDGDLMLVGDVPFDMFSGTCKKLRIIKRSEATGLGSK